MASLAKCEWSISDRESAAKDVDYTDLVGPGEYTMGGSLNYRSPASISTLGGYKS